MCIHYPRTYIYTLTHKEETHPITKDSTTIYYAGWGW